MEAKAALQAGPAALTAHRRPLKPLTGIRFLAAFYVVIFHTRLGALLSEHGHHAAGNFFANGYLAVPLFFLLSGFILAYTYEGQIERPGDHRRFWEARFARIWPVYAVSLLLGTLLSLKLPGPRVAVAVLCMVQAWNPFNTDLAGKWNMVCWTLSVEAVFYIVFPWVQTWIEERSSRMQLFITALMLLLCVVVDSPSRGPGYTPLGIYQWIPIPVLHLPEFFAGVGIGNYFLRRLALNTMKAGAPFLRGNGIWTYTSVAVTVALLCFPISRWTAVVVTAFAALLFGLAAEKTLLSRFLSTKTMLLGGGISYSVYLMQIPVKYWVQGMTEKLHLASEGLRFGVTALALIGISWLLFRGVEDPARKLLRKLFARMESKRDRTAENKTVTA